MPAIKQILTKVDALNGAQKRLGHYLQNDSTELLHSNVNDLAQAVGVSNSTVVRFAKSLGYKGFPEFKRDIQRELRRKLRAADRMEENFEQLAFMESTDVLIAIDFLQVPREVQTALQHAKKVDAPILGITDFPNSPIAKAANVCLYAKRGLHTTVNSLTPAFSLVNALAIAVGWAKQSDSIKALTDLDKLLEERGL